MTAAEATVLAAAEAVAGEHDLVGFWAEVQALKEAVGAMRRARKAAAEAEHSVTVYRQADGADG